MLGMERSLGVDLGTVSVLIFQKGKGVVLQEPSVVSILRDTGKILAVGEEAKNMIGKTPGNIIAIQPMKSGVIANYEITEKMLNYFIKKVCGNSKMFRPQVVICVPSGGTEVEKRAALEAAMQAGARQPNSPSTSSKVSFSLVERSLSSHRSIPIILGWSCCAVYNSPGSGQVSGRRAEACGRRPFDVGCWSSDTSCTRR